MAQLIDWARSLPPGAIDLIHIRDWHDPGDPAQRDHLGRFGAHCIKGSAGAQLILGMDARASVAANEVAACFLVAGGISAEAAIAAVRTARGPRALETATQEDFVVTFASAVQGR